MIGQLPLLSANCVVTFRGPAGNLPQWLLKKGTTLQDPPHVYMRDKVMYESGDRPSGVWVPRLMPTTVMVGTGITRYSVWYKYLREQSIGRG